MPRITRHSLRNSVLCAATLLGWHMGAQAQSLMEVYETAKHHDATFLSATHQFAANTARADQAVAGLLPSIGLSGTVSRSDYDPRYTIVNSVATPASQLPERFYGSRQYGLTLSQPLYRPGNWATYNQGKKQTLAAHAQLQTAEHDLMVRLSQTYFDLIVSQDNLVFVRAQKSAIVEQLAAAKRNFEVGTSTITDAREAQARFDLIEAQEIAALNDVRIKQLALDNLVGKEGVTPWRLKKGAVLPQLNMGEIATWVEIAQNDHPSVRAAQASLEVARLETQKTSAAHLPTLDATLSAVNVTNLHGTIASSNTNARYYLGTAALTLNIPLYSGGATQNAVKEKLALEERAAADLDGVKRSVAQATRTAFMGVVAGLGAVKAYEAAQASSQSALEANQLGYRVGVRINIDVLNAQSQLFQTRRDLAKARYDVLVGHLRLRQANGSLQAQDLTLLSSLLAAHE